MVPTIFCLGVCWEMGRFFVEELSGAYQSCLLTPCVSSCKKVSFFVFSMLSRSNLFCGSNFRKLPNNVANVPIFGRKYCCGRCFNDTFIGLKLLYLLLHFVAFFHVASRALELDNRIFFFHISA